MTDTVPPGGQLTSGKGQEKSTVNEKKKVKWKQNVLRTNDHFDLSEQLWAKQPVFTYKWMERLLRSGLSSSCPISTWYCPVQG